MTVHIVFTEQVINNFIFLDIDECAEGIDNCDENAQCTNNPGSFSCACKTGFSGNGITCVSTLNIFQSMLSPFILFACFLIH